MDWFDNCKVQQWRFSAVQEISVLLGYGIENVTVYWLLPEMVLPTGLRIVDSDAETAIMKQVAYKITILCSTLISTIHLRPLFQKL